MDDVKGGEGWWWEEEAREGSGEEEVNLTLDLTRWVWARGCGPGWQAQSRAHSPSCLQTWWYPHQSVTEPRKPQRFGRTSLPAGGVGQILLTD